MKATVIISTYNSPEWLEKVLWGYENQSVSDFSIIIADDGSGQETLELINSFKENSKLDILHVWQEDNGFRKTEILNKAISACNQDYVIFTDGDCIPRADFVETHIKFSEKGKFLSGGYCKLSMKTSKSITKKNIENQDCFDVKWLNKIEKLSISNSLKLGSSESKRKMLDKITPTKATFNGCNSSVFKEDVLAVNGFDERMKYGGEDREFGERLENMGVTGKQIRHKAVVLHLDHSRGYVTENDLVRNYNIRKVTKKNKVIKTSYGIYKLE